METVTPKTLTLDTLTLEQRDGIAWLRLRRPDRLNAISARMCEELLEVASQLRTASDLGALVLIGDGPSFCSGIDRDDLTVIFGRLARENAGSPEPVVAGIQRLQQMATWLDEVPFPTIAAVRGRAVGGGCELALSCDIRVATETASFSLPEVGLGLVTDLGGSQRLPRLIGLGRAKSMILGGEVVDGARAYAIGLAERLVADAELERYAQELALSMGASRQAAGEAKALLNAALDTPVAAGLALEARAMARCGSSSRFAAVAGRMSRGN